jgi:hypothetical protein
MSPDDAKTLAARLLARGQAARLTRVVSLPWRALGVVPGMRVRLGVVASALPAGPTAAWDCHNHVDVTLLGEHMWLEGRNDAAVLAGANMALLGKELFQFGIAEAIGPGRFRLSRLLRGRRGTERAVGDHGPGEAFLLLDPPGPVALEVGGERVGQVLLARPAGAFDMGAASQSLSLSGLSLLPFEPVHLRISREGDDLVAHWLRRSRGGFSWQDYVDAPLAEALEAYRVRISLDGVLVREVETGEARYRYSGVDRVVDGGGLYAHFEIAQLVAPLWTLKRERRWRP